MIKTLVATAFVLSSVSQAWAQQADANAMEIAQASGACSDTAIASARFLDDGRVSVRCAPGTVTNSVVSSQGQGLAVNGAIVAGAAALLLLAAAAGGSSSTSDTQ